MASEQQISGDGAGVATAEQTQDTLTVTDNRTGREYELEITDGTIRGLDLRQIKVDEDDFGLMSYDPAFTNTASCRSAITYIDGEEGILQHRGYPIEQLCEQSSYVEVAYLLVFGELPTAAQLERWKYDIVHHTFVHENIKKFVEGFRYDAHPMGMLLAPGRRPLDLLPGREPDRRSRGALHGGDRADREDADARGVRLSPQPRAAVHLSRQRPELLREPARDALHDD